MKVGIVIITYNTPVLLPTQLSLIERFCKDTDYEINVFDNSYDEKAAGDIEYHAREFGKTHRSCGYVRTRARAHDSSVSATFALNISFGNLSGKYDYFLYLDHDAFPLRDFSVVSELGDAIMAGVGQEKGKMYFHTGYLMFNATAIDRSLIDFSCNNEHGLDTGGNLYRVIEAYPDRVKYWNEEYEENPYFTQGFYNFYSVINNGMFMHFINGSGWNKLEKHKQTERINSLLNVLNEKVYG